jgi:hypothetical protein
MFKPPRVSRKEALERGQRLYFTGKSCRVEHRDYRLVANRACYACELARRVAAQTNDPSYVLRLLLQCDQKTNPREYIRIVGTRIPLEWRLRPYPNLPFASRLRLPEHIDGEPVTWGTLYGRVACFTNRYEARMSNPELVRRATPNWANKELIKAFYKERDRLQAQAPASWVVDHVIPLHHPKVCGLHVHNNLQVITMLENNRRRGMFAEETTVFSYSHSGWSNPSERILPCT